METQNYSILIYADIQKVWDKMLGAKTFTEWTTAFHKGVYFEGDWNNEVK